MVLIHSKKHKERKLVTKFITEKRDRGVMVERGGAGAHSESQCVIALFRFSLMAEWLDQ